MRYISPLICVSFIGMFATLPSAAKDNEADIVITGNLITPPPCKINDGKDIEVPFGNVPIKSIQGKEQKREVNYQFHCEENKNNWATYLTISGAKSSFDLNGLNSGINNLAVKFQLGDKELELDKKYLIDPKSPGTLWAVLVKNGNAELPTGDFAAYGTIVVEYQ
ncbi:fimbrial protein [Providencia sneebia]|uniref:Putative fimbrial-like adhesin exported protein n=1 Tax=Providencia sneebia DSM 19967 TaxID=1141660 RepID=K8VZY4_9GAMM|nr:fimbrial protein [Providencia sneebia]EKT53131.1 putative fimbrial-like adhesin exported protein [Providencia sneebia DSM 19967]